MTDAWLGTIGIWLAFAACICGAGAAVLGLVRQSKATATHRWR